MISAVVTEGGKYGILFVTVKYWITGSVWCCSRLPVMGWRPLFYPALPEKVVRRMDVRLYVGNLNKSTTEDELRALFAQAGNVSAAEIIKERGSNESKGFGFVTMTDQAEAEKAISMFNAYSLADRELKVNVAKPRTG
jgi:hypothetical protein